MRHSEHVSETREVIEFAKRHGGVVTNYEAAALGMTRRMLAKRIDDGVLVRLGRTLLGLPGAGTTSDLMLTAACRVLGAVVSHESAAVMHHFSPIPTPPPSVTVAHRSTNKLPGVIVHQSTDLIDAHVIERAALRYTSAPRTIIDLAKVLQPARLARVLDNALLENLVDLDDLHRLFLAIGRRGKKGTASFRRTLEARLEDAVPLESELEAALLDLIRNSGLPEPDRQFHAPWLRSSNGRVDFAYTTQRIVVEADGRQWHSHRDAFEVDRRRDNSAQLAGWIVLRFTYRMIRDDPIGVVSQIRSALSSRPRVRT